MSASMEEECNKLIMKSINNNHMNEYPITIDLHILPLFLIFLTYMVTLLLVKSLNVNGHKYGLDLVFMLSLV
ncbi:transmembrane protein, putative [Medicago truncatula]|uniref:Transmembrane protein, putative n=1 Tax=Medicago truncatula TaxID=3880 RepID=G7JPM5_MEDTR|nr:transmembrane protein, putative [Medicago truncatula]